MLWCSTVSYCLVLAWTTFVRLITFLRKFIDSWVKYAASMLKKKTYSKEAKSTLLNATECQLTIKLKDTDITSH